MEVGYKKGQKNMDVGQQNRRFTLLILVGMTLGVLLGFMYKAIEAQHIPFGVTDFFHALYAPHLSSDASSGGWFYYLGEAFMNLIKMLVLPIVFVSLVCGAAELKGMNDVGRLGGKTLGLYLFTTALAIVFALCIAQLFHVGDHVIKNGAVVNVVVQNPQTPRSIPAIIANLFPANLVQAFLNFEMLKIVVFALLFGLVLSSAGSAGDKLMEFFNALNAVLMKFMHMIVKLAPFGVFFLLTYNVSIMNLDEMMSLVVYSVILVAVLMLQLFGVYAGLLSLLARLNPVIFLMKMFNAMLFAFSVSSSSASIPVVLDTVKKKLGVDNGIASFVIPLGATINMDGTAIMQGVATIFITNYFGYHLGFSAYITIVLLATLASIGTAAVPSAGLITIIMILSQIGVSSEHITRGIALIFAVDRLLDMLRTAVNVAGDAMVSCVVARSENKLSLEVFNDAN
jgi:Na+/H+-dicarboxylate symporter